nr:MAG TPA: Protein of unknown function (DUF1340) [Caudoviricetes sp.]
MSVKYKYSGLTKELYRRLVSEYNALRVKYGREFNGRIRTVRNCDVREARKYSQKFCNVITERSRLSPNTAEDLKGLISDQLFNDLQAYLAENYRGKKCYHKHVSFDNAGLPEDLFKRYCEEIEAMREKYGKRVTTHIMSITGCTRQEAVKHTANLSKLYREINRLTPRKLIQIEGLISDELFGDIAKYVFNNYDWAAELDEDIDRIARRYRSKEGLGRNKATVKHYLYLAYSLGV